MMASRSPSRAMGTPVVVLMMRMTLSYAPKLVTAVGSSA